MTTHDLQSDICSFSSWDGKVPTLAYCGIVGEKK